MIAPKTLDDVLSDEGIVAQLKATGISITRRTVAKYRKDDEHPLVRATPPGEARRFVLMTAKA
ncbi:hypothetical protein QO004_006074 [Rhizobium mesoamericanum]|nr:hypothetical protein [Rhizobium mesoamericanum]